MNTFYYEIDGESLSSLIRRSRVLRNDRPKRDEYRREH